MINIVWQSYHKETPMRGYWDQGVLNAIFDRNLWSPIAGHEFVHREGFEELPEDADGAIVVIPARYHAGDVEKVNADIARLKWCLVMLIGDEEAAFPSEKLEHPNMMIYVMTPHMGKHPNADRFIVNGWPPSTRELLSMYTSEAKQRPLRWFFAGQNTHKRRKQCVAQLKNMDGGKLIETPGFTQGVPHAEYFQLMASARVVPCPSGAVIPDSFRLYEALEAGCVPIADGLSPTGDSKDYFKYLFDLPELPFPVLEDWHDLAGTVDYFNDIYPKGNNRAFAWWQGFKRQMVYNLEDDLHRLRGTQADLATADDKITVLIPTSPIPSHPDTHIIDETIATVRERLPKAEIMLMIDGVREAQMERYPDYAEYIQNLLWKANFEWHNVVPVLFETHHHQAAMTRETLKLVRTPTILFVEHDTPICNEIPFDNLIEAVTSGEANVIRLHHEALILEEHHYMMLDLTPSTVAGVPLVPTAQWSQRPHIASADFYRDMLNEYFTHDARTMIEDRIHGVVAEAYKRRYKAGWNRYKLWIYAPEGDMKRSYHTDGRETDPKYDMIF